MRRHKIRFFVCHAFQVIVDPDGCPIKWELISKLQKIQAEEGLNFANKLGIAHIDFQKQKMKVKLAAQVITHLKMVACDVLQQKSHLNFLGSELKCGGCHTIYEGIGSSRF